MIASDVNKLDFKFINGIINGFLSIDFKETLKFNYQRL